MNPRNNVTAGALFPAASLGRIVMDDLPVSITEPSLVVGQTPPLMPALVPSLPPPAPVAAIPAPTQVKTGLVSRTSPVGGPGDVWVPWATPTGLPPGVTYDGAMPEGPGLNLDPQQPQKQSSGLGWLLAAAAAALALS